MPIVEQVKLDGLARESLNLRFSADAADPNSLWPGVKGRFEGSGTITGPPSRPTGEVAFEGTNISYGNYTLNKIKGDFTVDSKDTNQSEGRLEIQNLRVAGEIIYSASFNWQGDFKKHIVRIFFLLFSITLPQ